jgi:hypothetical protein
MINRIRSTVLFVALVLLFAGVASACPTCKDGISENGGNLVRGYQWSIIFMMSMPFLILGGMSTMFYLDVRRARKRQELDASAALNLGSST